ncbi:hypothetical protein TNCV_3332501 [Trichonephila clavipes]|nr:hypothetical protein TNCV_3332501 [Trichonephila clavipes]
MAAANVRTSSHHPFEKGVLLDARPFRTKGRIGTTLRRSSMQTRPLRAPISSFLLVDATMILKIRFDRFGKDCHSWRRFSNSRKLKWN